MQLTLYMKEFKNIVLLLVLLLKDINNLEFLF